jgi:hypothetical protein
MEKNSLKVLMFLVAITSFLVIPIYGVSAEEDSISKEIQWCCSQEEENDDFKNILISNSLPNYNLSI